VIASELRPGPVALAVLVSVMAVVTFTVRQTNYGLYALCWTPFVVFLAAFGGLPPITAAADRAFDNLIGIALALAIFLAWPTWAATEVPRRVPGSPALTPRRPSNGWPPSPIGQGRSRQRLPTGSWPASTGMLSPPWP
jgi:hypothetical protein